MRQGKENRNQSVPLSPKLCAALKAYLPVRGTAQTDCFLTLHEQPVKDSLVRRPLRRYEQEAQLAFRRIAYGTQWPPVS